MEATKRGQREKCAYTLTISLCMYYSPATVILLIVESSVSLQSELLRCVLARVHCSLASFMHCLTSSSSSRHLQARNASSSSWCSYRVSGHDSVGHTLGHAQAGLQRMLLEEAADQQVLRLLRHRHLRPRHLWLCTFLNLATKTWPFGGDWGGFIAADTGAGGHPPGGGGF
jgi:hypothetical protein